MKALVLLSGGQDSTTCLYWAKKRYDKVHAITIDYNQRHKSEVDAARHIASVAGVASHKVVVIGDDVLESTSPLTSGNELEQYENIVQMGQVIGSRVESTFVPMRNMMFLTIAANLAVALGCGVIVIGACQDDIANYPDCSADFIFSIQDTINKSLGSCENIVIEAPLIHLNKKDVCLLANTLDGCMTALAYSHTSYDGKFPPTDMNHANVLRASGFEDACIPDPLVVRAWINGLMPLPNTANYGVNGSVNDLVLKMSQVLKKQRG